VKLENARLALRARTTLDVFDVAVRFFASNAKAYIVPSLVCVVPGAVIASLVGHEVGVTEGWLTALAISFFAATPVTTLTARLVFEEHPPRGEIIRDSMKRTLSLIPLRILEVVALALGTGLCVVPALWLSALFFVTPEIVIAENSGMVSTLERAKRIVSVAFADIASMGLLVVMLRVAFVLLADVAGRTVLEDLLQVNAPESIFQSGGGPISYTAFFLILPLEAVARFFSYLNVRTKTEGWDIQARFLAIARRHEESVAT
jgi:hypothetical protein